MPIYDQSYKHWEGYLEGRVFRWVPIMLNEIRQSFKTKKFLILFCLTMIPFVVRIGMIYAYNLVPELSKSAPRGAADGLAALATVDGLFYYNFLILNQFVGIVLLCLFVGTGLVARDLKTGALEIYFSKPITLLDYLTGKFAAMAFFLFCLTLFPGLLLFLSDYLLSDEGETFAAEAALLLGMIGVSLIITLTASLVVLAASSLCSTGRRAAVLWIGFHVTLLIASAILSKVFGLIELRLIDLRESVGYLARIILNVETNYQLHWVFSLLYLLVINALACVILLKRVKGTEVVK